MSKQEAPLYDLKTIENSLMDLFLVVCGPVMNIPLLYSSITMGINEHNTC